MAHVGGASSRDIVQMSSYSRRLRDNIKSLLDNYGEILRAAKVSSKIIKPIIVITYQYYDKVTRGNVNNC